MNVMEKEKALTKLKNVKLAMARNYKKKRRS